MLLAAFASFAAALPASSARATSALADGEPLAAEAGSVGWMEMGRALLDLSKAHLGVAGNPQGLEPPPGNINKTPLPGFLPTHTPGAFSKSSSRAQTLSFKP